jgi:hypothetical protein
MRRAKVYGGTDPALTYEVTSGSLVTGDEFYRGVDASEREKTWGTHAIEARER